MAAGGGGRTLKLTIIGSAKKAIAAVRKMGGALGKMGGAAKKAGKILAIGLGAGVLAVGTGFALAVRAAAGFDSAMTKSLAIMGNVSDAMRNDMAEAARVVAKTTTFSASQAADAYFFLASAGLSAKESIAVPEVRRVVLLRTQLP